MNETPDLSVVVVSLGEAAALARMLRALEGQEDARLEVVIPASPRVQRLLASPGTASPLARVVALGEEDEDPWRRRARGVAAARAAVVATLEDHALPAPDWARQVLRAHASLPHAAIGGVVEKAMPDHVPGWAMYFLDYGRYIPPQVEGPRGYLSACNVSYKRAALETVAQSWAGTMHETTVHFAMLAHGLTLWLDPSLRVVQRRSLTVRAGMAELRHHGRLFGRDRASTLSGAARLARLALAPLVPLSHVARTLGPVVRAPVLLGPWTRALPVLLAYAGAWALGEVAGLWGGKRP